MRIMPRYSILVTEVWVQDRDGPNEFWEGGKLVDSESLGDVVAAQWRMYTRGFSDDWLTDRPEQNDLRALKDA